jgi:acid phosphatase (class A)
MKKFMTMIVLACIFIIAGCAGFEKQSKPVEVPEIRPGILQGYLPSEAYPNNLALLLPPAEGSASFAHDQEISCTRTHINESVHQATKD